ncbi:SAFB-like transcription modulator [Halotydeus destructor]|nr:SAFB-like transcription modulator [Halotydeus destructor]
MASTQEESSVIAGETNSKKLADLRVADLKAELEKRGRDSKGVKQTLIERLAAALSEEGHDPSEHLFSTAETPTKSAGKKKAATNKMSTKEEKEDRECNNNEDEGQSKDEKSKQPEAPKAQSVKAKLESRKSGIEAADIVQDALQLDVDDELNEIRDNAAVEAGDENSQSQRASEEADGDEFRVKSDANENGTASPPKPESVPVLAPLTVADTIALDTSSQRKIGTDEMSMVVNVDDTRSELDIDLDASSASAPVSEEKSKKEKEGSGAKNEEKKPKNSGDSKKDSSKEKDAKKESHKESESKSSKGKTSASTTNKDAKTTPLKDKKLGPIPTRNIWISNLSNETRASDLQTLFKKHGKVVSAKIITNTKIPGARLYGLITMETAEQAEKCILALHKTELNGKPIHVGKNRPVENVRPPLRKREISKKSKSRSRSRSRSPGFRRRLPLRRPFGVSGLRRGMNTRGGPVNSGFRPIGPPLRRSEPEGRFRRERDRDFGDRDRRHAELERQDSERRAREERERLEREKEKLRIERERLEKEKAELLRLERERARQEREKIEREREEIAARRREAQMSARIIDDIPRGRPSSSVAPKRPFDGREADPYWDDRKRPTQIASQVSLPPRSFDSSSARFPNDFDNRNSGSSFDNRGGDSFKRKSDMGSFSSGRNADYERRDSSRHGHDRDDRRTSGGFSSSSYRDSRGGRASSRDRDRRSGGGRDDWKSRDSRSDRYDKNISAATSYGGNRSFPGGNRAMEWADERNQSAGDAYGALNPAMLAGNNANIGSIFPNSGLPMAGLISHGSVQPTNAGISSDRSYGGFHSVGRRF